MHAGIREKLAEIHPRVNIPTCGPIIKHLRIVQTRQMAQMNAMRMGFRSYYSVTGFSLRKYTNTHGVPIREPIREHPLLPPRLRALPSGYVTRKLLYMRTRGHELAKACGNAMYDALGNIALPPLSSYSTPTAQVRKII